MSNFEHRRPEDNRVDNEFYDRLGEDWYEREDHPIALLRSESRARNPMVRDQLLKHGSRTVLDLACGGGFLANYLAEQGFKVSALDVSPASVAVGKSRDRSSKVEWLVGDAKKTPFQNAQFDCVCMLDFLEHVPDPKNFLKEAVRVLRPGGLLCLYTFNRTPESWLLADKALRWFGGDAPENIHDWKWFIKPSELAKWCRELGCDTSESFGLKPRVSKSIVPFFLKNYSQIEFEKTRSLRVGYFMFAKKSV